MRDRTYAPQRRRGHAHVWHRIARLPYARPYAQKGIRPGDTTGISWGTWDHPGTLGPQEIIFSVQLYAPPNLCASKIAAHVIHKMHHFATVCAGTLCARIARHRRSKPVSNHALHQLYAQAKPYAQGVGIFDGRQYLDHLITPQNQGFPCGAFVPGMHYHPRFGLQMSFMK